MLSVSSWTGANTWCFDRTAIRSMGRRAVDARVVLGGRAPREPKHGKTVAKDEGQEPCRLLTSWCAPSGTRTPNPLKTAAVLGIFLDRPDLAPDLHERRIGGAGRWLLIPRYCGALPPLIGGIVAVVDAGNRVELR